MYLGKDLEEDFQIVEDLPGARTREEYWDGPRDVGRTEQLQGQRSCKENQVGEVIG